MHFGKIIFIGWLVTKFTLLHVLRQTLSYMVNFCIHFRPSNKLFGLENSGESQEFAGRME